jgi:hypothetical protein
MASGNPDVFATVQLLSFFAALKMFQFFRPDYEIRNQNTEDAIFPPFFRLPGINEGQKLLDGLSLKSLFLCFLLSLYDGSLSYVSLLVYVPLSLISAQTESDIDDFLVLRNFSTRVQRLCRFEDSF